MSRIGRTGQQVLISDKLLRMARAAAGRHTPTSAECVLARHMAHDGADIRDVHAALGWDCSIQTTTRRLARLNIHPRSSRPHAAGKAHRGQQTSLPPGTEPDMSDYRPRVRA